MRKLDLRDNPFKLICEGCTTFACCADCYNSDGFFTDIKPRELARLKEKFGWGEEGFLGADGCLLPRHKRSEMCLTYICPARRTKKAEKAARDAYIETTEEEEP